MFPASLSVLSPPLRYRAGNDPNPKKVVPDRTMKPIFSTRFRKDSYQTSCVTPLHLSSQCDFIPPIVKINHRIPDKILHKNFGCIFVTVCLFFSRNFFSFLEISGQKWVIFFQNSISRQKLCAKRWQKHKCWTGLLMSRVVSTDRVETSTGLVGFWSPPFLWRF